VIKKNREEQEMDLKQLFDFLEKTFSYNIGMLGNSDGYVVQIWDGYGIRRAYTHEGTLEKAIQKAIEQYNEKKEH
jgi:hypothetical protein